METLLKGEQQISNWLTKGETLKPTQKNYCLVIIHGKMTGTSGSRELKAVKNMGVLKCKKQYTDV